MTDKPVEDRVMSRKGDSPAQRLRTFQLRAMEGLREHPEWSAEKIGEEWGTPVEIIESMRSPREWEEYKATHDQARETYAERVTAELNRRKVNTERQAAFKRLVEVLGQPRPNLWTRIRRAVGRDQEISTPTQEDS